MCWTWQWTHGDNRGWLLDVKLTEVELSVGEDVFHASTNGNLAGVVDGLIVGVTVGIWMDCVVVGNTDN